METEAGGLLLPLGRSPFLPCSCASAQCQVDQGLVQGGSPFAKHHHPEGPTGGAQGALLHVAPHQPPRPPPFPGQFTAELVLESEILSHQHTVGSHKLTPSISLLDGS